MVEAVVIGTSAGGLQALKMILSNLNQNFPLPILVVQHIGVRADSFLAEYLNQNSMLTVKEAEDKEPICNGYVYLAPTQYHLLVEPDPTLSLSVDERVNYSCPAIDVLFKSAADVFRETLIGVVLTGANSDGALGLKAIKAHGGLAIVQDPCTAESPYMPQCALTATQVDYVVKLDQIPVLLTELASLNEREKYGTSG